MLVHIYRQMLNFLPIHIREKINNFVNLQLLQEIRVRENKVITLNVNGQMNYLTKNGLSNDKDNGILATKKDIEQALLTVADNSLYTISESLKQGYVTTNKGVRIGVVGTFVLEKGNIISVKDFTSLCIRIPHEIKGCSNKIFPYVFGQTVNSALIISAVGMGKTTLLKDLAKKLSNEKMNVAVIDERREFSSLLSNECQNVDVIKDLDKSSSFEILLKSMRPDVIVTDEIYTNRDIEFIEKAKSCGVKVIASTHGNNMLDVLLRMINLISNNIFDVYVILKNVGQVGVIDKILNNKGETIVEN